MDNRNKNEQQGDLPKTKLQEVSTAKEDGTRSNHQKKGYFTLAIIEALKRAENFDKEGLMDF